MALFTRRRTDTRFTTTGLVHRSDAGSQYTSFTFTQNLAEAGIAPSIGTVGDALDNALMESTIGLCKTELIDRHHRTWTGLADIEIATANYIRWSTTKGCTPRSTTYHRACSTADRTRSVVLDIDARQPRIRRE